MYYESRQVLNAHTCGLLIMDAERIGFEESPVRTGNSETMRKDIRNNSRVLFSPEDHFLQTLEYFFLERDIVPKQYKGMEFSRLNDVFRIYKYTDGQYFRPHKDGSIELEDEETQLTVLIYLNDCNSGATLSYPYGMSQVWSVRKMRCMQGYALVFDHDLWHEGEEVVNETKYVLRTDVFYKKN
jgi:hypothetical protein